MSAVDLTQIETTLAGPTQMTPSTAQAWLNSTVETGHLPIPGLPEAPAFDAQVAAPAGQLLDVHGVLRDVLQDNQAKARSRRIELSMRLLARNHYIHGDPQRLRQMLQQLVCGAIASTHAGGHLTFRSTRPADCAFRLEVEERSPWMRSRNPRTANQSSRHHA